MIYWGIVNVRNQQQVAMKIKLMDKDPLFDGKVLAVIKVMMAYRNRFAMGLRIIILPFIAIH